MPPDSISEPIFHLAARNITTLAWIVGGFLLLGAVLAQLRKLALALLSGLFRAGDDPGSGVAGKPQARRILAMLALIGLGGYGVAHFLPRAAERPVARLSPEDEADELARLQSQIDSLHAAGVAREAGMIGKPELVRQRVGFDGFGQSIYRPVRVRRPDYRNYKSYAHKALTPGTVPRLTAVTVTYHRRCSVCDQSFHARLKIDAIRLRQARAADAPPPPPPTGLQKGGLS